MCFKWIPTEQCNVTYFYKHNTMFSQQIIHVHVAQHVQKNTYVYDVKVDAKRSVLWFSKTHMCLMHNTHKSTNFHDSLCLQDSMRGWQLPHQILPSQHDNPAACCIVSSAWPSYTDTYSASGPHNTLSAQSSPTQECSAAQANTWQMVWIVFLAHSNTNDDICSWF